MPLQAWIHTIGGMMLLAAGATAILASKRKGLHTVAGEAYHALLLLTTATGLVVGAGDGQTSFFEIVTPPTYALGLLGYVSAKVRKRWGGKPWLQWHIIGQGGSYIGVWTAFGFQMVPPRVATMTPVITFALWFIPSLIGTLMIIIAANRWLPQEKP